MTKFAPEYKVCNMLNGVDEKAQVLVTTLGTLIKNFSGRKISKLKTLRCLVIDEADFFFTDENVIKDMGVLKEEIISKLDPSLQYVLFSATYKGEVNTRISGFVTKAYQIKVKIEALKHPKVQVFRYRVPHRQKIDFLMEIINDI